MSADQMEVLRALTAHLKERGAITWDNVENAADFIAGRMHNALLDPATPEDAQGSAAIERG